MMPPVNAATEEWWAQLVRGWFPELTNTQLRQVTWPTVEIAAECVAACCLTGPGSAAGHNPGSFEGVGASRAEYFWGSGSLRAPDQDAGLE